MVTGPMTSHDPERSNSQYLEKQLEMLFSNNR